jgi:hypothetical protein
MRGNPKCGHKGELNAFYGKKHTEETKRVIGEKSKVSYKVSGKDHPLWLGGASLEPYSKEFNDQMRDFIRMRDGYTCQLCGDTESELDKKLSCHHIDYDKQNAMPNNLISLCVLCHTKTNGNRKYWTGYFRNFLNIRQLSSKALKIPSKKNKEKQVAQMSMFIENNITEAK